MYATNRISLLLDGGYVTKQLESRHPQQFPDATEVAKVCETLLADPLLANYSLYRIYFYDCDPYSGTHPDPITKVPIVFGTNAVHRSHQSLLDTLEQTPNFSVRRGELIFKGWKLGPNALKALISGKNKNITSKSFLPDLQQKGVDMRIGLDIAALALKKLVGAVVLVTGDSDMVPAMKLARREGLRVYLHTLGKSGVRPQLKAHADIVIP